MRQIISALFRKPWLILATLTLILLGVIFMPLLMAGPSQAQPFCPTHTWDHDAGTLRVAIADTPQKIQTGLMFREDLADDEGMLFLLGGDQEVAFWMKNTPLPLDIVFLSPDLRVIRIARGVPFSTESLPSGAPSPFVLELKAGVAEDLGLRPGLPVGPFAPADAPEPCRD